MNDETPSVFISYSHDNDEHKVWVLGLAEKLVENGISVTLDQWDLAYGDDVPKFMEHGVTESHRVLMICTETYVQKADEGTGGVGYEAMVVTGELVRDLGTNKFIPIIRQHEEPYSVPTSVSTRKYINLSDSTDFDSQIVELLRELHKAPASPKPRLGPSPFSDQRQKKYSPQTVAGDDPASTYYDAINVARDDDMAAWRRIVREARRGTFEALMEWREKYNTGFPKDPDEHTAAIVEGLEGYKNLFAVALAGIESGKGAYTQQIGILEDLLTVPEWDRSGFIPVVNFPEMVAYVYQATTGALYLSTNQLSAAIRMGKARLPFQGTEVELYRRHDLATLPRSMGSTTTVAWQFITDFPKHWKWLEEPFGDQADFVAGLVAYYMALSILELSFLLSQDKAAMLDQDIWPDIPPLFLAVDERIQRKGYRLLINDPMQVRAIWEDLGVTNDAFAAAWPKWMQHTVKWHRSVYRFAFLDTPIHAGLLSEI